jgi:hypothetical protein
VNDPVNHPHHYTEGRAFEVIDVIEDWAGRAPDAVNLGQTESSAGS